MRYRNSCRTAALVALALAGAGGCASSSGTTYVHPAADLGAIRTVAVLPFVTLGQDQTAGPKVERVFLVELLATGVVEVVEPGRVSQLVTSQQLGAADTLTPADLQRIGAELGAEGLFLGTVVDFEDKRLGTAPAPEVTIQLRLVEAATGTTVWSSSESRSGARMKSRLLGFGGESLTQAARELIREQLETLVK